MRFIWLCGVLFLACDDGGESGAVDGTLADAVRDASIAPPDAGDAAADAAPDVEPDAAPDRGPPTADQYCERTVDLFCDYYVRCERMAVPDVAACRRVFSEACDAVYEPVYAAYAAHGQLALSAEGIAACATHLGGVACERQLFDLDGPCAAVWRGLVEAGGACGPGIGSFVCAPGTTCVLGLDLCGECAPHAALDEACGEGVRCAADAACVRDVCVRRAGVGDPCADTPCVSAATCVDDRCVGFEVVAVGEPCDRARRCPYKSECVAGACVETALLGEPCGDPVGCASGFCRLGVCAPLKGEGAVCGEGAECVGGICQAGACASPRGPCFTE